jgi:ABC-type transport system involved in multi-copper enzyme maturation permease subunit
VDIILGKFIGYSLMLSVFASLFYAAVLLIVHYNTGLNVPVKAGAIALFCLQPVILLAVTMFGTTFLSTLANGIACFMLYAVGVVGGMLEQIGTLLNSQVLVNIGIVSSLLMPADSVYRKIVYNLLSAPGASMSHLVLGPFGSNSEPSVWMLVYTGLYIVFFLAMASRIFSRKESSTRGRFETTDKGLFQIFHVRKPCFDRRPPVGRASARQSIGDIPRLVGGF